MVAYGRPRGSRCSPLIRVPIAGPISARSKISSRCLDGTVFSSSGLWKPEKIRSYRRKDVEVYAARQAEIDQLLTEIGADH